MNTTIINHNSVTILTRFNKMLKNIMKIAKIRRYTTTSPSIVISKEISDDLENKNVDWMQISYEQDNGRLIMEPMKFEKY